MARVYGRDEERFLEFSEQYSRFLCVGSSYLVVSVLRTSFREFNNVYFYDSLILVQ
jgi:hypothetical protein